VLRRWREADTAALASAVAANLEHLRPWMPWAAGHDRVASAAFLAGSELGWSRGTRFEYAIVGAADGALLGSAGLLARIGPGGLELGYWVGARWTRRGIATLAAALLSEAAFALPAVERVEIHHDEANVASSRVPARLGFRRLGTFPAPVRTPGEVGLVVRWRLDAGAFPSSPAAALLARGGAGGFR
jgi:ribosomal-protein-serine acetyltransferase